jgi:hypothetical protein
MKIVYRRQLSGLGEERMEAIEHPCEVVSYTRGGGLSYPRVHRERHLPHEMYDAVIPALPVKDTVKSSPRKGLS